MNRLRSINIFLIFSLLIFCALMLNLIIPYFSLRYDIDFLLTKQKIIHIKLWRYAFYLHVFLSIFAMLAGFTQFSGSLLRKYKNLHRSLGYVYVIDVLLLAGPSGLVMSFYANGTIVAKTSFVILSILWMVFTALAFIKAKQKQFKAHKRWMVRSYSLTLSAITLRLLAMVLPKFTHMNAFEAYALIAWLSWTLNLIISELVILKFYPDETLNL